MSQIKYFTNEYNARRYQRRRGGEVVETHFYENPYRGLYETLRELTGLPVHKYIVVKNRTVQLAINVDKK